MGRIKIHSLLIFLIRISLIVAISLSVWENNWFSVFISALALILTFIPDFVERKFKIMIPWELEILIALFIYAGVFLGGVRDFYYIYWWWDSILHFFSGLALGFIGFLILYVFYKTGKLKSPLWVIALFTFCFALALGAMWEIFEYLIDQFLGYNMQKSRWLCNLNYVCDSRLGVRDTMIDLILDAVGALIASVAGYFYLKRKSNIPFFNRFLKRFEEENKAIFKRKLK